MEDWIVKAIWQVIWGALAVTVLMAAAAGLWVWLA